MSKQHTGPRRLDSRSPALPRRQQKRARERRRQIEALAPGVTLARRARAADEIADEIAADALAADAARGSAPEPPVETLLSGNGVASESAPEAGSAPSRERAGGLDESPETVEPTRAEPRPEASGHKHPTLAVMAAIAERGNATGPLSTSRARIPAVAANQAAPRHVIPTMPDTFATPVTPRSRPGMELSLRTLDRAAMRRDEVRPATSGSVEAARSAARMPQPRPFPALDPLLPVAGVHAALAAVAALAGALLMLRGNTLALALLILAAVAAVSAGLAYLLDQQRARRGILGGILACAQIGMLGWALMMIGPRAALLAGVPALAIVMGRVFGRARAQLQACAMLLVYGAGVLLANAGRLVPLLVPHGTVATGLDAALGLLGTLFTLWALNGVLAGRERALAQVRAREFEARTLRETLARERAQVEADSEGIRTALNAAMRRRLVVPLAAEGSLGLLATVTNRVVERMAELQREREERALYEDALRRLIRALERSWLGLPEAWPEQTGTPVDEIVALLRAPRPVENPSWPEDAPTLISLLSLRRAREQSGVLAAVSAATAGTRSRRRAPMLAEVTPPQAGAASSRWTEHDADEWSGESTD